MYSIYFLGTNIKYIFSKKKEIFKWFFLPIRFSIQYRMHRGRGSCKEKEQSGYVGWTQKSMGSITQHITSIYPIKYFSVYFLFNQGFNKVTTKKVLDFHLLLFVPCRRLRKHRSFTQQWRRREIELSTLSLLSPMTPPSLLPGNDQKFPKLIRSRRR